MLHPVDLSDAEWRSIVDAHGVDASIKDWVDVQIARGRDYYSRRIARLGLRGDSVLDAGCGIGNWAIGLAGWFRRVDALEIDATRLAILGAVAQKVGRITLTLGSIEDLPYPDRSFDAVFCNGVFYLTRYRRTLQEFKRVLKPGGVLYATFNTYAWWRHLLKDRAKTEPVCTYYGANALIATVFRYLDELAFAQKASSEIRKQLSRLLLQHFGGSSLLPRAVHSAYRRYRELSGTSETIRVFENAVLESFRIEAKRLADSTPKFRLAADMVRDLAKIELREVAGISIAYRERIVRDILSRMALGRPDYTIEIQTHSFENDDIVAELGRYGYRRISVSFEGTLALNPRSIDVAPIYTPELGVSEFCAWTEM